MTNDDLPPDLLAKIDARLARMREGLIAKAKERLAKVGINKFTRPDEAAALYDQGLSDMQIAEQMNICPATVIVHLRKAGRIQRQVLKPYAERNAAIVKMRESGATYRQIAETLGVTKHRARQIVVTTKSRGGTYYRP